MELGKLVQIDAKLLKLAERSSFSNLIATATFQRLKGVSFLGAIDPWLNQFKSSRLVQSDRFHHSIGVFSIATKIIELDKNFPDGEKRLFQASALLHDLGHGPLSHSLESIFNREFGINHHKRTSELILDSKGDIYKALRSLHIIPSDITLILDKRVNAYFSRYLNGPFNVDTLDGIYRCFALNGYKTDYSLHSTVEATLMRFEQDKIENILDSFWRMKGEMYNLLIYQGYGRIADEIAQNFLEKNIEQVTPEMFKMTDQEFYSRFDTLKRHISNTVKSAMDGHYLAHVGKTKSRMFQIRHRCRIENSKSLGYRYYEEKKDWVQVKSRSSVVPHEVYQTRELI